jgi:hypothetical protein
MKRRRFHQRRFYLIIQDDSKRPLCLMAQTGLNDEYLIVSWSGNLIQKKTF